jgi:sortase (surface protein transpeptidase)
VLAGHVDSATAGLGAFAALLKVEVGDPVIVVAADGKVATYRIVARRSYPKQALPADVFDQSVPARLVLITCGGAFDRHRRIYLDNVVVYATST